MKQFITPALLLSLMACSEESQERDTTSAGPRVSNWSAYLGDYGRSHYSPLTQIDRDNVASLELTWVYDSGPLRPGNSTLHTSPIIVDGVLYGLSPTLDAFALVAATGQELWRYPTGDSGAEQRGLMWWQDEARRRLLYTAGSELIALDADTGLPIPDFGNAGRVDLSLAARPGPLFVAFPGVIFEDSVILGFSTSETSNALPGSIAAFSAIDGTELWRFHSLPQEGGLGSETWEEGSLATAGGANNWTSMTLDAERGVLYVPTGSATPDFYGAARKGDNLFANSVIALDARSGDYRWHFQTVRHDLWDRDLPSPPTLVQLERGGQTIDAVAVPTKTGHLYLLDRDTGESLYEIIETTTPSDGLPGELTASTQPLSTVAFTRQQFETSTRNADATAFVNEQIAELNTRQWAPPSFDGTLLYPAFDGGAGWGGAAYDPAGHKLIINAQEVGGLFRLVKVPRGDFNRGIYLTHCAGCHNADLSGSDVAPGLEGVTDRMNPQQLDQIIAEGRGRMPAFAELGESETAAILEFLALPRTEDSVEVDPDDYSMGFAGYLRVKDHEGLPGNTPPWGTLSSLDLATGNIDWQVNLGNYLSHPDLNMGAENYGGPVVTASGLIFIASTPDQKFRVFDSADGAILWETDLPAAGFATPAVYGINGRQYVVIAAGGGKLGAPSGSYYLAYSLP